MRRIRCLNPWSKIKHAGGGVMDKILFLYFDPHFLHSAFARAVGADFLSPDFALGWKKSQKIQVHRKIFGILASVSLLPRGYDVYLCEGTFIVPTIAKKLRMLNRGKKIINIISDPLVYYLHSGVIKGAKKCVLLNLLRKVDGFICVGDMERELLSEFVEKPTRVVDPFVPEELYQRYLGISPDLSSNNILFIATGPDWYYKGLDMLIEGFKVAKEEISGLKLNVVGDWKPLEDWLVNGVKFVGRQKSLIPYLEKSSLYVHVGRGDAFGISVLEAMLSGLPAIVSKWTGAKEVVKNLGRDHVSDIQPMDVANKIMKYFNLSLEKRKALSRKARILAAEYREDKKIELFKSEFQKLMEDLD